ncbi:hypothetical protein BDV25DRAFT_151700 [Aspergillus avenaceus]|uniref:tyrosinase n=1 Tax=Aspergillus avenaceus TaxID=36643 RepID=A0A5N6U0C4_ASPAV|nr:hypothetical protein BDV25DRAFT_151700 [Aspergillus avenaceus]
MVYERRSLQELQALYDAGDHLPLDKLVKALRHIQSLPADDEDSFHKIGGYHGEPFRYNTAPPDRTGDWWGGYCFHSCVLFPTWHRAYMLRLENSLRKVEGCEDVTLPFWDECFGMNEKSPQLPVIPSILTSPMYTIETETFDNPLYSFKLKACLIDKTVGNENRYTKKAGYETVRYPLSGLVGTDEDARSTEIHNSRYTDATTRATILNGNVANWLSTGPIIPDDGHGTKPPSDTTSVYKRYAHCLTAPSYTIFSNTTSQQKVMINKAQNENEASWLMSLESPHNAIHLAVGGFYQQGAMNADPIIGANGDMGDNETAGFDPIFFLHHCFIDYVFWQWQVQHDAKDTLIIDEKDEGAKVPKGGILNLPEGTSLTMDTPLPPFLKPGYTTPGTNNENCYTSRDMVNIEKLGYKYGKGSLDPALAAPSPYLPNPIKQMVKVSNIKRAKYKGSFVIRTYAKNPDSESHPWIEIGREPVLSRWNVNNCANCQNHLDAMSVIALDDVLINHLLGPDWASQGRSVKEIQYLVEIHSHDKGKRLFTPTPGMDDDQPTLEHLIDNETL